MPDCSPSLWAFGGQAVFSWVLRSQRVMFSDSTVKQREGARSHSRGANSARALRHFPPSKIRGRREDRVLAAPAVPCAVCA
jgi:hypothetical protein